MKNKTKQKNNCYHAGNAYNHISGLYDYTQTKYVVGAGGNNCVILLNKDKKTAQEQVAIHKYKLMCNTQTNII